MRGRYRRGGNPVVCEPGTDGFERVRMQRNEIGD